MANKDWRTRLYEVVFEADTPAGRRFDITVICCILISVVLVMLESVQRIEKSYGDLLRLGEWIFTILFTIEYILRLISVKDPKKYLTSFYGLIDLLAIIPTYLGFFFPGGRVLVVIRAIRLLRIFRILKLSHYISEANVITTALHASRPKIIVFLFTITTSVFIIGSLMYLVEGEENGFTNIPVSVYWAIVTMTTVGYGDISPKTPLGQTLASLIMILGYGIIAVPTGIVSVEIANATKKRVTTQVCPNCFSEGHDFDAKFCKYCGHQL